MARHVTQNIDTARIIVEALEGTVLGVAFVVVAPSLDNGAIRRSREGGSLT
jgi:hypothetical protein